MAKRKKSSNAYRTSLEVIILLCLAVVAVIALNGKFGSKPDIPEPTDTSLSAGFSTRSTDDSTDSSVKSETKTVSPSASEKTDTATDSKTTSSSSATSSTSSVGTSTNTYSPTVDTTSFDKDSWYLLLVNYENYLPKDFSVSLTKVQGVREMDVRCADAMIAMIKDAKADGISLLICSAYRSYERQVENFNAKVQEYRNLGYTEENAFAATAKLIAIPGTSEHHTGLTADIVTPSYQNLNAGFAKTDAFAWLYEHCAEYGFIMRYPSDKEDITKIVYEPWHYRYVGKEAAQIIMSEGICLEEFLEKYGT